MDNRGGAWVRIRGEFWAVAAALSFIGLELSVRTAVGYAPASLASFVRVVPIFVLSWLATLASDDARRELGLLVGARGGVLVAALAVDGILNMYVANALKIYALQRGGIVLTLTAVEVGQLVGTALLVRWWLGHRVSRPVWLGMLAIIAGTAVASWSQVFIPAWPTVLGISLVAGLCFALSVTCVGYVLRHGIGLWPALSASSTVGLAVTAIAATLSGQAPAPAAIAHIGATGLAFLLLSGIAYACALFFLTGALQRISIVSANAISGANGPAAALVGALIFGPNVTFLLVAGVVLVAIGAVMVRTRNARDELEDAPKPAPSRALHATR
jgi:drug/metabolite transporter (DMT)-like permease